MTVSGPSLGGFSLTAPSLAAGACTTSDLTPNFNLERRTEEQRGQRPQFFLRPTGLRALGWGPLGLAGIRSRSPSALRSCCRRPGNWCLALHIGWSSGDHWTGLTRCPLGTTQKTPPQDGCAFPVAAGSGGSGAMHASHLCVSRSAARTRSGGARGTPPRSPSLRAALPAASLHGSAPVSPPAGLSLCAGPSTAAASLARPPGGPAPSWLASCICMSTGPAPPPPARACEARGGGGGGSLLAAREPER